MDAKSGFSVVVLVALVAAFAPRLEAREVRATETYLVPVLLRGHPYVISVSSSYSVDVDYASSSSPDSPKDKAAASQGFGPEDTDDEDKVADRLDDFSSFVTFFDENKTDHEKRNHKHSEESEDFIYLVAAEEDEDAGVDADKVVSSLLVDDADLHWLQEQIDLLSRFEASPSLDSVPRGGHRGRKNCNKGRIDWRHHHDEDSWARQIFHPSSNFGGHDGPSASPFGLPSFLLDTQQDLYHPLDHQPRRPGPVFSGEAAGGGAQPKHHPKHQENVGRMVGMLVLSILIICLYVVVIFGAIYMVLITMGILIQGCWRWCFGVRVAPEGYEALLDEDEDEDEDERECEDGEAQLSSSRFSCAVGVALSANSGEAEAETVHLLIHENPLVTTFDDVVRK